MIHNFENVWYFNAFVKKNCRGELCERLSAILFFPMPPGARKKIIEEVLDLSQPLEPSDAKVELRRASNGGLIE